MIERKAKRHAKAAVFAAAHAKYWEQFNGLYEKIMGYHSELLALVRENDIEVIERLQKKLEERKKALERKS